jgi:hypothetical protein
MIIGLLIVIVAIMVFGAAAVKGALNAGIAVVAALLVVSGAAYVISNVFGLSGANVFVWLIIAIPSIFFAAVVLFAIYRLFYPQEPPKGGNW